jgi:MFS family permease
MSILVSKKLQLLYKTAGGQVQAANFFHLYWDVAWYGVVFGSTLSFIPVFTTRLGATGWQIGLLSAGPALVSILFTLPAGRWVQAQPLGRAVTRTAFWQRLGFFCLIPFPFILPASFQVWAVLLLTLLMAIPGAALMIGFNALLATTVSPEWRGHVVGRRNALLAGTIAGTFIFSGWILDWLPFEWGYVLVFSLGAFGATMSTYHLSRIKVPSTSQFQGHPLGDRAQPGRVFALSSSFPHRLSVGLRLWLNWRPGITNTLRHISNRYWWVMLAFFLFHFTQLLSAPLFPIFWVREARLTDGEIGWINALFYLTMLTVSPLLAPLTKRLGNYRLTGGGAILLALYPLLTALSTNIWLLIVACLAGGIIWAILSGAIINRLFELIPEDNQPSHLAIYNLALNVAILSSTMLGPLLADVTGLREALFLVAVLRVGSGLALLRWG